MVSMLVSQVKTNCAHHFPVEPSLFSCTRSETSCRVEVDQATVLPVELCL